jgi:hypothetical protein
LAEALNGKCPPKFAGGARNKLTGLSVITLSSLTERFFKDDHTVFYEIYGAEQCKNRDY